MNATTNYTYLAPCEGSRYEQYFFRGRNLRAETLYRATIGPDPMTPDEVAEDYDVPLAAVLEAIQYALRMPRFSKGNEKKTGTKATPEVLWNRHL